MKISSRQRDLIFFAALLLMVKAAWNLSIKKPKDSSTTATPTTTVGNSLSQPSQPHTKQTKGSQDDPFSVHEVDQHVLEQIDYIQKQVDLTLPLISSSTLECAQLQSMKQRLMQLKRSYQHTSPAVALLGPIGYTGIVLKEQKAERDILKMINKLNLILYTLAPKEEEYVPVGKIADGIQISHTMLEQLTGEEINYHETVN